MPESLESSWGDGDELQTICARYGDGPARMMDILRDTQTRFRWILPEAMETIVSHTGLSRIAVEGVASFYAFFCLEPRVR